jgi:hypothetical protein
LYEKLRTTLLVPAQPSKLDQHPRGSAHDVVSRFLELVEGFRGGTNRGSFEGFSEYFYLLSRPLAYALAKSTRLMVA